MFLSLSEPLVVAGKPLATIDIRPPGRRVFEVMRLERGPLRFPEAAVVRFAARLSGHSESTIRRLHAADLDAVGKIIEELYVLARRRFAARTALAESVWTTVEAEREAKE